MKVFEFFFGLLVLLTLFLGVPFLLWLLASTNELSQTIERVLP